MSGPVVESQPTFSSGYSFGTTSISSSFCNHTASSSSHQNPFSVSDDLFDTFRTTELPKMQLDTESLYSLISGSQSQGHKELDEKNSAPLKPSTDTHDGSKWSNSVASSQHPTSTSTDSLPNQLERRASTETEVPFTCTPTFLPSKVEQLHHVLDGHYAANSSNVNGTHTLTGVTNSRRRVSLNLPSVHENESAMDQLSTELDERLKVSQRKQSLELDFLSRMAATIEPSAVGTGEKKFMTMTERIQVPTSDHVAEIVGKNGQRIKHLREQLKVWVKTPSRDELPVFEITGLPEKLVEAKRIILQMSEHFTKVQQERQQRAEPNRVEDRLYVEQDKVGLIVGASGQTIRWVQQLSDTHIATPRKQESIPGLPPPQTYFTICGTRERVRFAKQLICEYVNLRCQGLWLDRDLDTSSEAARLVQEFHQRRQVEDTQRRGSAPAGVSIATAAAAALARLSSAHGNESGSDAAGGAASTSEPAAAAAAADQLSSLASVKRLWQEGGPPPAVWDSVLFAGIPPPPLPPMPTAALTSVPPPPLFGSGLTDRRYSMDAHTTARMQQYQQQVQLMQQQQQQQQQKQQRKTEEEELDSQQQLLLGFDPLGKKKCQSDELVLQAAASTEPNGWM